MKSNSHFPGSPNANPVNYMHLLIVSLLCFLISGCSNNEAQKKQFSRNVSASYVLLVFQTESNFSLIGTTLQNWQQYGLEFANKLEMGKSDFKTDEDLIRKIRENKEVNIELYMAVVDLYDIAVKVDSLKASQGGYSLFTYAAKRQALKEEWESKKNKVKLLMKN